jgi:predicted dehydrogenase
MRKVVWGVLSTARIGIQKVIPGMQKSAWCEMHAIASRSIASAESAARALGIPKAYGSYDELLADPDIEAVYNPLPNHLHIPLTLKAARAGKHVLCEKPMAMSADEAAMLREVEGKVLVMEAFMVRFHPQWLRARELVREGRVGDLRVVQMLFCYANTDPGNIRNIAEAGGGALYDIGCYAITAGRYFFEAEPNRCIALIERDPRFGTDRLTSALVDFGAGRQLVFSCSTQASPFQRIQLSGSGGRIEIQVPVNAAQGARTTLLVDDGTPGGAGIRSESIEESDQYLLQGEAFSRAVRGEIQLPWGVEDAVRGMRVIDALFRSEKSGCWELVGGD